MSRFGTQKPGTMAMYDEYCFERWSDRMEREYLSRKEEEEEHACCNCGKDAEEYIDGSWYCDECAEEIMND